MHNKLISIAEGEKVLYNDDVIKSITYISGGDMRSAIMLLQNIKYIIKNTDNKEITVDDVYEMANWMPNGQLSKTWDICVKKKKATLVNVLNEAIKIRNNGYPISNIIYQFNDMIVNEDSLTDLMKSEMFIKLAIAEKQLIDGADEHIQLLNILSNFFNIARS
jgi:replication factor C subunit 2/4